MISFTWGALNLKWVLINLWIFSVYDNLRTFPHTPGTYARPPTNSLWRNSFHLGVWGSLGYAPGVCWGSLRDKKTTYPKKEKQTYLSSPSPSFRNFGTTQQTQVGPVHGEQTEPANGDGNKNPAAFDLFIRNQFHLFVLVQNSMNSVFFAFFCWTPLKSIETK